MDQYNKMPPAVQEVFDSLVGDKMLFGSRSMAARWASETFNPAVKIGCRIDSETDYDIAAEFNAENVTALRNAGFNSKMNNELYAADHLTQAISAKVIASSTDPLNLFAYNMTVHVVLRKQNTFFMTVWDNIDAEYYYNYLWKRGPKFATDRYRKQNSDMVKKEIRDAMNQLYASAEFNDFGDNKLFS
jgi:hypothetical protein